MTMARTFRIALSLIVLVAAATTAQAQNLIFNNYATGTNIVSLWGQQPNPDDTTVNRALGGTFNLFGVGHTTADISTNGNINFAANTIIPTSGNTLPNTTLGAMILPLGTDLRAYTATPSAAYELTGAGFYSMTWENQGFFGEANTINHTFQAAWFNAPTTVQGFNFQANDIAFDYNHVNVTSTGGTGTFPNGGAIVGLNNGDGVNAAVLPGSAGGLVTDANASSLLPINDNRFVLFRFNAASGTYTASIQSFGSSVPEPATYALTAGGLGLVLACYRRSRSRRRAKSKKPTAAPAKA